MLKAVAGTPYKRYIISLEQDGDDVNICASDGIATILLAWFSECGRLNLAENGDDEDLDTLKKMGFAIVNGRVEVA